MAKQVAVRLVSEGGQELKAIFQGVGQTGEQAFKKIGLQSKSAAASAEVFEAAMRKDRQQVDQLKAALDPLHRASMLYSQSVNQINDSLARGLLTKREAIRLTELARQKYVGMSTGIDGVAVAANRNSPIIRGMSLQLSQVAQQGAATGDYLKALAIQLPDLAIGFGTLGILAGVAAGALLPFAVNALKGEDAVASLADAMKELDAAMSRLEASSANSGLGVSDLQQKYRGMADEAREFFAIEREIAALRAGEALKSASRSLAGELDVGGSIGLDPEQIRGSESALASMTEELRRLQTASGLSDSELRATIARIGELKDEIDALRGVRKNFDDLAKVLGVTEAAAQEIAARFAEIEQAEGARAQADAMISLVRYISDVSDNLADAKDGGQELYDRLIEATQQALAFAALDIAAPVTDAANEAARLAKNLDAAMRAQRASNLGEQYALYGAGRVAGEELVREAGALYGGTGDVLADHKAKLTKSTRRGGGGAQKEQNELLREAERIYEGTRTEAEKYNEAVSEADKLLKAGLITQDTYNRHLADLQEELQKTSGMQSFKDGIEDISDALADAIVTGEDLGEAMGKIFRQIARDLISSGIKSLLMQTFGFGGGGGLFGGFVSNPFSLKQSTGMLSGLGIGQNANGTDYWPGGLTRIHESGAEIIDLPRGSRVIPHDLSKKMTSGSDRQSVHINVNVDGARGNAEIQEMVAVGVMQGLEQYDRSLPGKVNQITKDPRAN